MTSTIQSQKSKRITIGISEMGIGKDDTLIITIGLGSCVGITLWDPITKIGGLSHIMLPDSTKIKNRSRYKPGKYANTAFPLLIKYMEKAGAKKRRLIAKIAGGAQMFSFSSFNVGERNVKKVKEILKENRITLSAEDCLGTKGRTILLNCKNGELIVKKIGKNMKKI